jgi:hypothetical protein
MVCNPNVQEVKANKEKTRELAERAAMWLETLVNTLHDINKHPEELEKLRTQVEGMLRSVIQSVLGRCSSRPLTTTEH